MGDEWAMSPLTPAFPSVLSANGSSPAVPLAALAWVFVLCCFAATVPATTHRRAAAVLLGVALAILAFAADFFAPLAVLALLAGFALERTRRGLPWRSVAVVVAGALTGGVLLFGAARQFGGTGAAGGLHLEWNATFGTTPVYGGSHALLAGGEARPFPNWPAIHDWGVLFWPGIVLAVVGALRLRDATLLAGAAAALGAALFWHTLTVATPAGRRRTCGCRCTATPAWPRRVWPPCSRRPFTPASPDGARRARPARVRIDARAVVAAAGERSTRRRA
jgi:hypothetical protein